MRLAISNIAWDVAEDENVALLLRRYKVDAIDIAPRKYFPQPTQSTASEIGRVRDWWCGKGIEVTGMQALLFGTVGLNVFGTPLVQEEMLQYLDAICKIGAGLGASRLVFGSPKNRDRTSLSDSEANTLAICFFGRLGNIADSYGVTICLEPNPPCYGANFMTTSLETALMVKQINHPAIRMQLDTGAMAINGEDPATVMRESAGLIGHIHASEPDLIPLGDGQTDHGKVNEALRTSMADYLVCIEMQATQAEPHLSSIERALKVAIHHYRNNQGGQTA